MHESRYDEHLLAPCTWAVLRQATRAVTQLYERLFSAAGLHIRPFTALKAMYETGQLAEWQYSKENNIAPKTLSRGSEPCAGRAGGRSKRSTTLAASSRATLASCGTKPCHRLP